MWYIISFYLYIIGSWWKNSNDENILHFDFREKKTYKLKLTFYFLVGNFRNTKKKLFDLIISIQLFYIIKKYTHTQQNSFFTKKGKQNKR